jgi:carbonic anhydrase/acetyltransferase-like protein (isoleucine patch superfamily)
MVHKIGQDEPEIDATAFVAWNAEVAGAATIGQGASVWFSTVVRADMAPVSIGAGSNLQDGTVVHVDAGTPTIVGKNITVGHRAILHGCTIGDGSLIGMGAIMLNGSEVGPESIVAAGSLVTQGKKFPARSMLMGSPAKLVRQVSDEEAARNLENSRRYVGMAKAAKESGCEH